MAHSSWTKPEFRELNLSAEIGSYYEEEDIPLFVSSSRPVRGHDASSAQDGEHEGGRQ
jgi:coenzyme PQQ precursor peptide PqqA